MTPQELADRLAHDLPDCPVIGPEGVSLRHPGEHGDNLKALVMAEPRHAADVSALLCWAAANGVGVVPQGGRTGLVGGNITHAGELIISTARMNKILAIHPEEKTVTVEAGVTLQALQEALMPYGLVPGIDLAARGSATIGGMVSTNAGGILAFRNGVMRHQVLGLEAVLPNGSIFSDLARVVKVSAGPDLKHLFIGAEGAFGFVTRVVLKLEARRSERATALIGVEDARTALAIIADLQAQAAVQLEGAELMWRSFFADSCRAHDFDRNFLPEESPAILLVEVSAEDAARAADILEDRLEALWEPLSLTGGIVARSIDQSRRFWLLREAADFIYREHPAAPSFDVSLPPMSIDAYVEAMRQRLKSVDAGYEVYVYGHIADGNLHLSVTHAGDVDAKTMLEIEAAIYSGVNEAGGSFSAEHGIGLDKKGAYQTHVSRKKQELAVAIKHLLDPTGLLNHGKVPFAEPIKTRNED